MRTIQTRRRLGNGKQSRDAQTQSPWKQILVQVLHAVIGMKVSWVVCIPSEMLLLFLLLSLKLIFFFHTWNPYTECVQDEVMTGFLTGNTPISRITIGALEDLGYGVDYSKADPFTAADLDPACSCVRRRNLRVLQNQGNNGKKDAPPGLSKKGEEQAIQFGYGILAENLAKEYPEAPDNLTDKGQEFVIVFFYEDGHIYSLRVTPEDL